MTIHDLRFHQICDSQFTILVQRAARNSHFGSIAIRLDSYLSRLLECIQTSLITFRRFKGVVEMVADYMASSCFTLVCGKNIVAAPQPARGAYCYFRENYVKHNNIYYEYYEHISNVN